MAIPTPNQIVLTLPRNVHTRTIRAICTVLCPMIHRNHPVLLDKRGAGEATPFQIGVNRIGEVSPVD